jgi:hypothetical protein
MFKNLRKKLKEKGQEPLLELDVAILETSLKKVTRIEVIDNSGRAYVSWDKNIEFSIQDNGRTLKIFIKPKNMKKLHEVIGSKLFAMNSENYKSEKEAIKEVKETLIESDTSFFLEVISEYIFERTGENIPINEL